MIIKITAKGSLMRPSQRKHLCGFGCNVWELQSISVSIHISADFQLKGINHLTPTESLVLVIWLNSF